MADVNIVVAVPQPQPRVQISAYDCFLRHFYNQVFRPGCDKTLDQVHRIAEQRWKCMTTAERKPYKEIASMERERLVGMEMQSTGNGITLTSESSGRKRKRNKAAKNPNAPKRATTAFFFFAHEERKNIKDANPEFKVTEISKTLGKMWRDMDDQQKEKFVRLAEQDRIRYQEEMKLYNEANGGSGDSGGQAEEYNEEDE